MPQRLIGFTLLVLLGVLEPFSLKGQDLQPPPPAGLQTAIFAGGCFWCMVHPFEVIDGVISTISGYTGGSVANPTYEQVSAGGTGHRESVEVRLRSQEGQLSKLYSMSTGATSIRSTTRASSATRAISTARPSSSRTTSRKLTAEASKRKLEERFGRPIATDILPAGPFYRAEEYHQDYYKKNPLRYRFYRFSCGRDARLKQVWGDEAGGGEK